MNKTIFTNKILLLALVFGLLACDNDDETPALRASINYSTLTPTTPYPELFVDGSGNSTVDRSEGNNRYKMFQALNSYMSANTSANTEIEASVLSDMFSNTNAPFTDATLNTSGVQLKNVVATSRISSETEAVREKFESLFSEIELASQSINETASAGQAGKLENRLVDAKGIEVAQVIQKSLIGALQLDYIGNVLLDEGLFTDNSKTMDGKPYTQREHIWDEAYGLLTLNDIYLEGATDTNKGTTEFGLGSYVWEYNKTDYAQIYPAFLKGRAAIVNNDRATLEEQATFIRTAFEKAIASAALGYLEKWKSGTQTDAARSHAISEGLGFIYSLRFAAIHNADAQFSDDILEDLIESENGYWDLTAAKINAASEAIKEKFAL